MCVLDQSAILRPLCLSVSLLPMLDLRCFGSGSLYYRKFSVSLACPFHFFSFASYVFVWSEVSSIFPLLKDCFGEFFLIQIEGLKTDGIVLYAVNTVKPLEVCDLLGAKNKL